MLEYSKRKLPPCDILKGRGSVNGFYSRYYDTEYIQDFYEDYSNGQEQYFQAQDNNETFLDMSKDATQESQEVAGQSRHKSRLDMLKGKSSPQQTNDTVGDKKSLLGKFSLGNRKEKSTVSEQPENNEYVRTKKSLFGKSKKGSSEDYSDYVPKNKKKKPSPKFVTDEELAEMGYPKEYFDPSDEEFDDAGQARYFFNIDKTMTKYGLEKVKKFLPMQKLDKLTFEKEPLDNFAAKQHDSARKLSELSPKEQYQHDCKVSTYKKAAIAGTIFLVIYLIIGVIFPNIMFSKAMTSFNAKDWEAASKNFKLAGSHENAKAYKVFCDGMISLDKKDYDTAKTHFDKLDEMNVDNLEGVDTSTLEEQIQFKKAIDFYNSGDFNNAKKCFYNISKYENASEYYYKCGYKLGSDYYEAGDLVSALREFYLVRNYSDAQKRLEEIASGIYTKGNEFYNKKKFKEGAAEFKKIASYAYKDADAMQHQCAYRNAIDLIVQRKYEEAIPVLAEIGSYKDANALLSESYYRIGNATFNSSTSEAIKYYSKIKYFRDTSKKLLMPQLAIYGTWKVLEIDNVANGNIEFTFNENNEVVTKTNMQNVALSTEALSNPYRWVNNKYVCNGYSIDIEVQDQNNIKISCDNGGLKTLYRCERISSLGEAIRMSEDTTNKFEKDTIEYYIQQYINKKTDGTVILNGKKLSFSDMLNNTATAKLNTDANKSTKDEASKQE